MDHLRALEVFCAVAENENFTVAAGLLAISPPTATRIVNELEAHLGAPLLIRTTRKVALTDSGSAYLVDAKRILKQVKSADEAAKGAMSTPAGTLRITASVMFGQLYVAPVIQEYLSFYPDVSVEAVFVDRITNPIEEGFDIAVRIGPLADSGLRAIPIGNVRAVVCGSNDYFKRYGEPQHPAELSNHSTISYSGMNAPDRWEFDGGVSVKVKPRLSHNSIPPCIAAAKTGWGLARVLSYQVAPELAEGSLIETLQSYSKSQWPINLVHPHGRIQSAKVRTFLELAKRRLGDHKLLS